MVAGISAITISLRGPALRTLDSPFQSYGREARRRGGPLVHRRNGEDERSIRSPRTRAAEPHMLLVFWVGGDIGRNQHDRFVGRVLPPVRQMTFN